MEAKIRRALEAIVGHIQPKQSHANFMEQLLFAVAYLRVVEVEPILLKWAKERRLEIVFSAGQTLHVLLLRVLVGLSHAPDLHTVLIRDLHDVRTMVVVLRVATEIITMDTRKRFH
ncbi:MAG: hypothetical protein IPH75_14780 [bacterium]|nr:hypothetical protein [bacterium]